MEYKYVLIRGRRRDKVKWELNGMGNHRRLRITEELLREGFWDDGDFGHIPGFSREKREASALKICLK